MVIYRLTGIFEMINGGGNEDCSYKKITAEMYNAMFSFRFSWKTKYTSIETCVTTEAYISYQSATPCRTKIKGIIYIKIEGINIGLSFL